MVGMNTSKSFWISWALFATFFLSKIQFVLWGLLTKVNTFSPFIRFLRLNPFFRQCTEVCFASFLSSEFTIMAVINPPEIGNYQKTPLCKFLIHLMSADDSQGVRMKISWKYLQIVWSEWNEWTLKGVDLY